jgi:hypothetical protein
MAVRADKDTVRAYMEGKIPDIIDADVDLFINSANVMVNNVLGTGTSSLLTEIENWLTCHMIASTRERQAKKEEAGGAKVEYTGFWKLGLQSTSYGQMVLVLDTSGAFASLGGKSASITAITSFD